MNPQSQPSIDMSYRIKYLALGIITYVVVKYAWKVYKTKTEE